MTDSRDFKKEYPASSYAEVITRTLCVPASAFNLP